MTRQVLESLKYIDKRIEGRESEIMRMSQYIEYDTGCLSDYIIRLHREVQALQDEKRIGLEWIEAIPDERDRQIFMLRYNDGLTWQEIADRMNYCIEQVQRRHKRIIDRI